MTVKETMFALLVAIIALAWGAKDWLAWHWNTLSESGKIKWIAGFVLLLVLLCHKFITPFIWQNFS